jgi:uncharacterized protein (DUF2384 family)
VDAHEFFPGGGTVRTDVSDSVREHALRVFQDADKAARWMNTRLSELDEHTPEELLASDPEAVDAVLDRLEYGVFW